MRSFVVAAAIAAAAASAFAADDPVAPAMEAYKAGDYAKAVELASAVKTDDPARPRAAYVVGESNLMLEKWDDAQAAFKEILDKKADSVPALVGFGRAQIGKGANDDAITTLEKATKLDAKDAAARRSLGEAHLAKNETDKALADLSAATKLDPKDPLASRSLTELLLKGDKTDAAQKEASRLAAVIPDHPMGHFLAGYVFDKQKKIKDAIEEYEKAIAKDDKFIDAHKNLAILCVSQNPNYQDKDKTKKALEHFKRYFELGGKDEQLKQTYEQIKGFIEGKGGGK
jgi:tetratricopeptide (TPR) repeat protein